MIIKDIIHFSVFHSTCTRGGVAAHEALKSHSMQNHTPAAGMACFIRKQKQMVAAKQDEEEMENKDRS